MTNVATDSLIFKCSLQAVTTNRVLLKMWFVVSFLFDLFTS